MVWQVEQAGPELAVIERSVSFSPETIIDALEALETARLIRTRPLVLWAAVTGVPSRTVRHYQWVGALPRPARKGRIEFFRTK